MGFSLRPLGRRIWEGITPNDEGAQRRANANLVRANQALQQPAKYGALRNQQTKNQFVKSQQPVKFSVSTAARDSFTQRAVPSVSAGLARSAVGTAEGLSGLYDLATPGLGTNRFTKKTVELGGGIDRFVDKNNLDKTGYKLGQFSGEAASFLAPSAFAKSLSKGAKAGGVVGKGANFLAKTDPLINKTGLKYLSKPSTYTNVIPGVARMSGYRTARGQDVSPQTVAQDTAISLTFGKALDTVGNRVAEPVFSKLRKPEVQLPKQPKPTVKVKPNAEFNAQLKKLDGEVNTLRRSPATPEGEARLRAVRKEQAELKQKIKNNKNQTGGGFLGEEPTIKNVYGEDVPNPNYIDPKVSIRMQKDYIEAMPPRKGSALSGEGAKLPPKAGTTVASVDPITKKITVTKLNQGGGGATGDSEVLSVLRKLKGEGLSIGQRLSPDRVIREGITEPLREGVNKAIFKAQTSDNPLLQGAGRLTTGVSRELGTSQELMAAKRALHGGVETGKLLREDIADAGKGFDKLSKERIWATLDPEQANKTGTKLLSTLTPEEVAHRNVLVQQRDSVTNELSKRGLLTPEQANKQDYFKRAYSIFEESSDNSKAYNQTRAALLKQFKGRKDVTGDLLDTAIKDPDWLMAKKTAEAHSAMAMVDYGSTLKKMGMTSDVPKAGYVQLPSSKVFGEAAGKYVPKGVSEDFTGFQYNNGMMSAFNDMITAYDSLGIRKAKKELLTIFNPAVRVGNQFSNRVVFSNLNGINPVQFNKNMFLAKAEIKNRGPLYREAVSQGLTGLDVTQADFARRISQYADDPNIAKKSIEYAKKSYSQADDQARIAAYMTHRNRGYSPEEAAKLTQRGFQDYKSVGFFYDIAAKTPLVGNAFVRFAADAVRIAGNAALDHPLRSIATIALWANFVNIMSKVSGESAEDKKTREDRFGAPKLPFSNISTAVQTPWGEVNVSRFLPFYQLNETQSSIGKFLPIQGNPLNPKNWNDPLLGQFGQIAKDKDFRDKSIRDPDNSGQFKDKLPQSQQVKNVARFLGVGNMPLGKEIDAVTSAIRGTGDIYGKKRSVPQALARAMGVKVEQQGAEQQKATRGMNDYYDEKAKIDEQVKGMEPKDQEAYKRVTGYYKLREKTTNEFDTSKQRYVKDAVYNFPEDKWKEYTTSPKIYDLMMEKKIKDSQKQGSPLQPEFDKTLSTEFRKQLINNKSQAPGEDVEADERLYSSSEWDTYQKLKADYSAKAKKYYPQKNGEFKDELVKHETSQFPAKPPAKAAYDAAYAKYAKGQGPKPTFNDQVAAAKDKYTEDKRVWTNNERKARGLPPISQEVWNNVTFGFESDEEKVYKQLKYGKGYGGYASGGGGSGASSYYGKSKSSVKGKVSTSSIKGKAPVKLKGSVKYTAAGKPKVSIKKALT